jgi:hypothetical protein
MRAAKKAPAEIDPIKIAKKSVADVRRNAKQQIAKGGAKAEKAKERLAAVEKVVDVLSRKAPAIVSADSLEGIPENLKKWAKAQEVVFRPNPGPQTDFLAASEQEVFYGGARGGGKASNVNSYVATPFGFRRMGDLKVGDRICSTDGGVSRILAVHPQGEVDLYRVTTDDGGQTEVTLDHLWLVSLVGTQGQRKMTTGLLIEKLANGAKVMIPTADPVCWVKNGRYNMRKLDPYVLGVLLGDGCLRKTISLASADPELVEDVQSRLLDGRLRKTNSPYQYNLIEAPQTREELKRLGLWDHLAYDKFVPDSYLHAGPEDRLLLLQGLMDTDGTADAEGRLSFCSVSEQLAKDVQFLVRSLGGKATISRKENEHAGAYIVYISIARPVFRLRRKLERQNQEKHVWRAIRSIEPCGRGHAQCITVDHPNSLYVTDDFIVTHNSYAMLVDPLRYCTNRNHRALILRRTMPELRDMIHKSQMLYPKAYAGAKWREQEKEWRFPSGARIEFGYAENITDANRYQGSSYSFIGVDELPQFPSPDIWNFLRSSLRSVDPNLPTYMRATGNPGNVGSFWVKEMFIDPAPPNTRFEVPIKIARPGVGVIETSITRKYIPSTVFDNPYLTYDDNYIAMLASLPEVQRRQFLEGDWSAFDNAAFSEFKVADHVVEPFEIPPGWVRWRACDWGFSSPACVLWFAADPDNNVFVYDELYVKGITADRFARMVVKRDEGAPMQTQILDASVWAMRGDVGPSIAEVMNQNGCRWRPSDRSPRSRKNGKLEVHRRLAMREFGDGTEAPGVRIFSTCRNLIRTLPLLPLDPNDPEDVDTKVEDHAYDAFRYGLSARQMNTLSWDWASSSSQGFTPANARFGY